MSEQEQNLGVTAEEAGETEEVKAKKPPHSPENIDDLDMGGYGEGDLRLYKVSGTLDK
jgi:hypothetical protein